MKLIKDNGIEEFVCMNPTRDAIRESLKSLDWDGDEIVQLLVMLDVKNCADVSGSTKDGLSMMFESNGIQHVSELPPSGHAEMENFLFAFAQSDLKTVYEITYAREFSDGELARFIEMSEQVAFNTDMTSAISGCMAIVFAALLVMIAIIGFIFSLCI